MSIASRVGTYIGVGIATIAMLPVALVFKCMGPVEDGRAEREVIESLRRRKRR